MKTKSNSANNTLYSLNKLSTYIVSFFCVCALLSVAFYFISDNAIIKGFLLMTAIMSALVLLFDCVPSFRKIKTLELGQLQRNDSPHLIKDIKTDSKKMQILGLVPILSGIFLVCCIILDWTNLYGVLLAICLISGIFLAFELIQNYLLDILIHELKKDVDQQKKESD
jgi:hypothetical protein